MVASQNASMVNPTWFTDSGEANHVTSDLSNLKLHSKYHGNYMVGVGNGNILSISLYWFIYYPSFSKYFSLE